MPLDDEFDEVLRLHFGDGVRRDEERCEWHSAVGSFSGHAMCLMLFGSCMYGSSNSRDRSSSLSGGT